MTTWIHIFGARAVLIQYCSRVAFLLVLGWEGGYSGAAKGLGILEGRPTPVGNSALFVTNI